MVHNVPTVLVNTAVISGTVSMKNVFGVICAGYATGTDPAVCLDCAKCSDPVACVKAGAKCQDLNGGDIGGGGVATFFFVTSMLVVIAFFAGFMAWHYIRSRLDRHASVLGILAEYMPLEDQDDGSSHMDVARTGGGASLISKGA